MSSQTNSTYPGARGFNRLGVRIGRPALASVLRMLPHVFGERGRRHAFWRAHYALPAWIDDRPLLLPVFRQGIWWRLDLRDNVQRSLFYTGDYEGELAALLRAERRPGDVYVDVGAHIGTHALPMARFLGKNSGRVIAFEPAADTKQVLESSAARNRLHALTIVEAGLSQEPGTMVLREDVEFDRADAGVRSRFGSGPPVCTAQVVVFDEWAADTGLDRMDIVKVDVEGAEYDVLASMRGSLQRLRPRLIVVEMLASRLEAAGTSESAVSELLQSLGYAVAGTVDGRNVCFRPGD